MSNLPIGIDLGTTYSAVATLNAKGGVHLLPNSEGSLLTPSAIFFESPGNIIVGQIAKDARVDTPDSVVEFIKRSMGTERKFRYVNEEFTPAELSAIILKKLKRDAELALGGQRITKAVVTCPAYFGAEKRDATEKAAQMAGLELLALINEPTSAAMAFGMNGNKTGTVLVFDLGGGTFDVTVLKFGGDNSIDVLAVDGNHELGGKDFDDAIMQILIEQFNKTHHYDIATDFEALGELRQRAEKAKHELTLRNTTSVRVAAGGFKSTFELTREQFAQAIAPKIEGMRLTLWNVLDEINLEPKDINDVIMIGGSSRVPAVYEMVATFFNLTPNTSVHPDEAVARGAALFAAQLLTAQDGQAKAPEVRETVARLPSVKDIVPHSIGTSALWDEDEQLHNSIILKRGSKLGIPSQQTYYTIYDGQDSVDIDINEGEGDDLEFVKRIASFTLELAQPGPKGTPVTVEVMLDRSGVLRVLAIELKTGQRKAVDIAYESNLSEKQITERANWLESQNVR